MPEQSGVTLEEMIKEAKRESQMRRRVYPKWIDKGFLKHSDAQNQIRVMDGIVEFLERSKQPSLF